MKFNKWSRGFTLIELLVVIAIIGILSSIVLASLGTARGKANDSAVKEQMSGLRSAAEVYYASTGNYGTTGSASACPAAGLVATTFFADAASNAASIASSTVISAGGAANALCATGLSGGTTAGSWAMAVQLPSKSGYWCVDSNGTSRGTATSTGAAYTSLSGAAPAAIVTSNPVVQCN